MGFNSVSNGLDKYAEKVRQLLKAEQDNVQKGNDQLKKITDSHNKTNTNKTDSTANSEQVTQKTGEQVAQPKTDKAELPNKQPVLESVEQQRSDFVATKQEANAFARNILKDNPKMAQHAEISKAPETLKQTSKDIIDNLVKQEIPNQVLKDATPKSAKEPKTNEKPDARQSLSSDKLDKNEKVRDQKDLNSNAVLKEAVKGDVAVKATPEFVGVETKKDNDKPEAKSEKKRASENIILTSRGASKGLRQLNEGFGFDTNTNLNGGSEEGFYLDATAINIEKLDELPAGTLSGLVGATFDEGEVVGSSGFLDKARYFHTQVLREQSIRTTIASVSEMEDQFGMPVEKRIPSEHLKQIRLGRSTHGVYGGLIG